MRLENKVALITGAGTGLGREGALLFAREGACVIVADINDVEGNETVHLIRQAGGEALFVHADMSSLPDLKAMVKSGTDAFGKLDIFWHNAGIPGPGSIETTTEERYDRVMDINLKAGFFGSKFVIPELRRQGGGCILFSSSGAGNRPSAGSPSYSVTKAGLQMLARCLAYALGDNNIRVNCVCPGLMDTPSHVEFMSRNNVSREAYTKMAIERRALKRFGTLNEVAQAALFLVSDDASYITGEALGADGGGSAG